MENKSFRPMVIDLAVAATRCAVRHGLAAHVRRQSDEAEIPEIDAAYGCGYIAAMVDMHYVMNAGGGQQGDALLMKLLSEITSIRKTVESAETN